MAQAMRELSVRVEPRGDGLVDTAGTGGGRPTYNVSTTAAFVAAGAGCRVAKHGNRSATGRSGSADVLEALGARIDLGPEAVAECIDDVGFGFMFAPAHHPAMKHVVGVRKELAVRTIFNFLGPLTNPAGARRQLIGVSEPRFLDIVAGALRELGCDHALVVSSDDGLDELSVSGVTRMVELRDGAIEAHELTPEAVGLQRTPADAQAAGTPERNAGIARQVLAGDPGPERDLCVLNAAAAIYVGGGAESIEQGARRAEVDRHPVAGVRRAVRGPPIARVPSERDAHVVHLLDAVIARGERCRGVAGEGVVRAWRIRFGEGHRCTHPGA